MTYLQQYHGQKVQWGPKWLRRVELVSWRRWASGGRSDEKGSHPRLSFHCPGLATAYCVLLLHGSAITLPPPVKIFWLCGMGRGAPLGSHCTLCLRISSFITSVYSYSFTCLPPSRPYTLCKRRRCFIHTWHRVWHMVGIPTIIAESTEGEGTWAEAPA